VNKKRNHVGVAVARFIGHRHRSNWADNLQSTTEERYANLKEAWYEIADVKRNSQTRLC